MCIVVEGVDVRFGRYRQMNLLLLLLEDLKVSPTSYRECLKAAIGVIGSQVELHARLLERSGKDFNIMEKLPSGFYQFKFIVDGEFRHAPDLPFMCDERGNTYNYIDLKDYVPENLGTIAEFEPPQSPDSSYNNMFLGAEDFAKEPPAAPPQLQQTLLNTAIQAGAPATWPRPQHVVLNHLYVLKGRSRQSPVALGSTYRFQSKYVTLVLYKSQQR
ncbi:SNF1-related protein kinase regulatory subunit beta-2 [Asimina triloba]